MLSIQPMGTGGDDREPRAQYVAIDDEWRTNVKDALKELGWTQQDLARRAGIAKSTLTYLLNGTVGSTSAALRISELLHLPPPGFGDLQTWRALQWLRKLRAHAPDTYLKVLDGIRRQHALIDVEPENSR